MQPGSVIVDVAITREAASKPLKTNYLPIRYLSSMMSFIMPSPIFPGGSRTSTLALTNATLPYLLEIAKRLETSSA